MTIEEIVEQCYQGGFFNPGEEGRRAVEFPKGRIFDINVCTLPGCRCGWNIRIGGGDYALLDKIIELLQESEA